MSTNRTNNLINELRLEFYTGDEGIKFNIIQEADDLIYRLRVLKDIELKNQSIKTTKEV